MKYAKRLAAERDLMTDAQRAESDRLFALGQTTSATVRRLCTLQGRAEHLDAQNERAGIDPHRRGEIDALFWAIELILVEVCPEIREEFERVAIARSEHLRFRRSIGTLQAVQQSSAMSAPTYPKAQ